MKNKFTPPSGSITRRRFLYYSALAASATTFTAYSKSKPRKLNAGDKLRIASVGGGGKGGSDIASSCRGGARRADRSRSANSRLEQPAHLAAGHYASRG